MFHVYTLIKEATKKYLHNMHESLGKKNKWQRRKNAW